MTRKLTDKDGEVRELTAEDMKKFRPARDADPGMIVAAKASRGRGRPPKSVHRQMISFRLDPSLVDAIRSSGKGYNARVEHALKEALDKGKI